MKKKIFLTIGVCFFTIGLVYTFSNYEIVYYPKDQPAIPLESLSILSNGRVITEDVETDSIGGYRIGDFVFRKKD